MKLQILDLARNDLIDGYRYYEKKEDGLGSYFLSNLYSDIETLKVFAGIHSKPYKDFHRALSKRFPFAIYYTIAERTIYVRAVVDCRKKPTWIRKHLNAA